MSMTTLGEKLYAFIYVTYLVLLLALLSAGVSKSVPEYKQECVVWDKVTQSLEGQPKLNTSCVRNTQCTGFDCIGQYRYQGVLTMFQQFTVDTCFGLAIHPCHKPVDVHVYVELPEKNASFQRNFENDSLIAIPGAVYRVGHHMEAASFLAVTTEHATIGGYPCLKIGMTLKIRLTTTVLQTWPASLQVPLMSKECVPIPKCNSHVVTPNHPLGTCKPGFVPRQRPTPPSGTGSTPATTTTTTYSPYIEGCLKACEPDTHGGCSAHEFCHPLTSGGVCCCMPNYMSSDSGCILRTVSTTTVEVFYDNVTSTESATPLPTFAPDKSTKKTIIIASSCVVSVIVIAIICLALTLHFRKQRERYGQHELLLNNEGDEDDTDEMT